MSTTPTLADKSIVVGMILATAGSAIAPINTQANEYQQPDFQNNVAVVQVVESGNNLNKFDNMSLEEFKASQNINQELSQSEQRYNDLVADGYTAHRDYEHDELMILKNSEGDVQIFVSQSIAEENYDLSQDNLDYDQAKQDMKLYGEMYKKMLDRGSLNSHDGEPIPNKAFAELIKQAAVYNSKSVDQERGNAAEFFYEGLKGAGWEVSEYSFGDLNAAKSPDGEHYELIHEDDFFKVSNEDLENTSTSDLEYLYSADYLADIEQGRENDYKRLTDRFEVPESEIEERREFDKVAIQNILDDVAQIRPMPYIENETPSQQNDLSMDSIIDEIKGFVEPDNYVMKTQEQEFEQMIEEMPKIKNPSSAQNEFGGEEPMSLVSNKTNEFGGEAPKAKSNIDKKPDIASVHKPSKPKNI